MSRLFLAAYLEAYLFWLGITLGALAILLLHELVGGAWGRALRPILESSVLTLPIMGILFLPILLGLHRLYPWIDSPLPGRESYLNLPFFLIRTSLYFLAWLSLTALYYRARRTGRGIPRISALGLIIYGLTVSFAAIDWVMSLEPTFFSSAFGVLIIVGQILSTLAFGVAMLVRPKLSEPEASPHSAPLHDLGNLLLMAVMLWAYIAFSQYLIIWSAQLPEEIPWYRTRLAFPWLWVAIGLIVLHFLLPFFLLLSRKVKRAPHALFVLCLGILVMRVFDHLWLISPAFLTKGSAFSGLELITFIGVGGVWLWKFRANMRVET